MYNGVMDEEQEDINLHFEENTLRTLGKNISLPFLIHGNKMFLVLSGLTEKDIEKEFSYHFTTLNYLLDLENCKIYLDYGYNREELTRDILNEITQMK